jgi:CheY-like chemotaxis protein
VSKILLVEDDAAIRRLIRDTLEWDGHTLLEASTGEAGRAQDRVGCASPSHDASLRASRSGAIGLDR